MRRFEAVLAVLVLSGPSRVATAAEPPTVQVYDGSRRPASQVATLTAPRKGLFREPPTIMVERIDGQGIYWPGAFFWRSPTGGLPAIYGPVLGITYSSLELLPGAYDIEVFYWNQAPAPGGSTAWSETTRTVRVTLAAGHAYALTSGFRVSPTHFDVVVRDLTTKQTTKY
jgi:hypothetical protein